jgi:hypothetical protein
MDRLDKILGESGYALFKRSSMKQSSNESSTSSLSMKVETKKSQTTTVTTSSIEDPKNVHIAKIIAESNKRNSIVAKRESNRSTKGGQQIKKEFKDKKADNDTMLSASKTPINSKDTTRSNKVLDRKKVDNQQKNTFHSNERPSKKEENGLSDLPIHASFKKAEYPAASVAKPDIKRIEMKEKERYVKKEKDMRITKKDENGLSGLPFVNATPWKETKADIKPSIDEKDHFSSSFDNDGSRLTSQETDGLMGLPFANLISWKTHSTGEPSSQKKEPRKRENENWNNGENEKKRKLNGNDYPHSDPVGDSRDRGRGRGRGKDINKPAWMTRQESSSVVSEPNVVSVSNHSQNTYNDHRNLERGNSDANIGRGRGRGRGKDINKPAWMTKQENSLGSASGSIRSNPNNIQNVQKKIEQSPERGIRDVSRNDEVANRGTGGLGRGRGKNINKPAWMTRQESNVSSNNSNTRSDLSNAQCTQRNEQVPEKSARDIDRGISRGRGRGKDINKPAWMTKQESGLGSASRTSQSTTNKMQSSHDQSTERSIRDSNSGVGRGRGKDMNKPAWMTRQDSSSVVSEPNVVSTSNHSQNVSSIHNSNKRKSEIGSSDTSVGRGRGRGRGKDINKPAWMTKQESILGSTNAPVRNSSKPIQQVADNGSSGFDRDVGRGRGRGKDINKPAWLTRQESNINVAPESTLKFVPRSTSRQESGSSNAATRDNSKSTTSNSRRSSWVPPGSQNNSTSGSSKRYR